ncbi:MAG: CarD family transcriptional regulator, partial [Parachlamydiaceae bacterium]|nr:CarD family transcriptional regulator [Parachlamydiaceae bacterium]
MSKLSAYLQSKQLVNLQQAIKNNESILIEELWNSPKALVASLVQETTGKHVLILTGGSQEETRLYHDFSYFTDCPIVDFPSWETLPSENIAPSPDIVGERYQVLHELKNSNQPHIIISGLQACLQRLIVPKLFSSLSLIIQVGKNISFEELISKLGTMGYQRCPIATDKGEFAVRGGIIDIFPVSSPDPFRLEFWGNELDSIRVYDPIGQKSIRTVETIEIYPGVELELLQQQSSQGTIFDYLGSDTIVIFDDLMALEDRYASLVSMGCKNKYFSSIEEFLDQLNPMQKIFLSQQSIEELSEIKLENAKNKSYYSQNVSFLRLSFELFNRQWTMNKWNHPFNTITGFLFEHEEEPSNEELLNRLSQLDPKKTELHLLVSSELEEENLRKKIHDAQVLLPKKTFFDRGYLSSGLVLQDIEYVLFPFTELSHRYKIRRQKLRSTYHTTPAETYHLLPGELVVHLNNGIGKYLGIEKKINHLGILSEFFVIEYAEQAKLYVPFNQAHYISKYIGANESLPKYHTLGSPQWKKTREQTEKAILGYA